MKTTPGHPPFDIGVKLTILHLQFVVSVTKVMSVSVEAIIPLYNTNYKNGSHYRASELI